MAWKIALESQLRHNMIYIHLYLSKFFLGPDLFLCMFVMMTLEIVPMVDECNADLDVHSKVDELYKNM